MLNCDVNLKMASEKVVAELRELYRILGLVEKDMKEIPNPTYYWCRLSIEKDGYFPSFKGKISEYREYLTFVKDLKGVVRNRDDKECIMDTIMVVGRAVQKILTEYKNLEGLRLTEKSGNSELYDYWSDVDRDPEFDIDCGSESESCSSDSDYDDIQDYTEDEMVEGMERVEERMVEAKEKSGVGLKRMEDLLF